MASKMTVTHFCKAPLLIGCDVRYNLKRLSVSSETKRDMHYLETNRIMKTRRMSDVVLLQNVGNKF
nr:hypothetical protein [Tanacetum cinerariifolium]